MRARRWWETLSGGYRAGVAGAAFPSQPPALALVLFGCWRLLLSRGKKWEPKLTLSQSWCVHKGILNKLRLLLHLWFFRECFHWALLCSPRVPFGLCASTIKRVFKRYKDKKNLKHDVQAVLTSSSDYLLVLFPKGS